MGPFGDFHFTWAVALCAVAAFFIGTIPFGLLLTRFGGYGDIRAIGSGNIGATNVLRTGNKKLALLTLLLDAGKGAVAVLVARRFGPDMAAAAALFVLLGHLFPPWLGFKGGKGVATAAGVLLAYAWPVGLAAVATWLVVAIITRYSSLAAMAAAVLIPTYAVLLSLPQERAIVISILALLVILRHTSNLRRLLRGQESKIELRRKQG